MKASDIPKDRVKARGGHVVRFEHWVNWNGEQWPVEVITRRADGTFSKVCGDPEHGGGPAQTGSLQEILSDMPVGQRRKFKALFELTSVSRETVNSAGFRRTAIDYLPAGVV